jgi:hypothetical protein
MKRLQLFPRTHRQKETLEVRFPYELQLIEKLKEKKGVHWKQKKNSSASYQNLMSNAIT